MAAAYKQNQQCSDKMTPKLENFEWQPILEIASMQS